MAFFNDLGLSRPAIEPRSQANVRKKINFQKLTVPFYLEDYFPIVEKYAQATVFYLNLSLYLRLLTSNQQRHILFYKKL